MQESDRSLIEQMLGDIEDSYDEELDPALEEQRYSSADVPGDVSIDRLRYFRELFRLQGLVTLQD